MWNLKRTTRHCCTRPSRCLAVVSFATNILLVFLYLKHRTLFTESSTDFVTTHQPEVTKLNESQKIKGSSIKLNRDLDVDNYKKAFPYATDPGATGDTTINIVSWTGKQPGRREWFRTGAFSRCPNLSPWMKCSYTVHDFSVPAVNSHAILFHARSIKYTTPMPSAHPPHQKWIFYETESPVQVWSHVNKSWPFVWTQFNLTATYTWDSHIPLHHHRFKCTPVIYEAIGNVAAQKTSKVAWFVSNCHSASAREVYVKELQLYIEVDIFGACGQPMCKNKSQVSVDNTACVNKLLNSTYKFYLSLENSFCREYVTEKLHKVLDLDIIPIVMGSYDYKNLLPPGTYIDVRNFTSPRHLADYLLQLDQNDELYNGYIRRKRSYECKRYYYRHFHCDLCEYLHVHRYEKQVVKNGAEFWSVARRCQTPREFYKGVADDILDSLD